MAEIRGDVEAVQSAGRVGRRRVDTSEASFAGGIWKRQLLDNLQTMIKTVGEIQAGLHG